MCYYCGEAIPAGRSIGFSETCASCGKDLHVCVMCSFHQPGAHWDCRETIDAQVPDKEKRNFCEWFSPDLRYGKAGTGRPEARSAADSAKSAFDSLFGR
jgi:hypothetical protein